MEKKELTIIIEDGETGEIYEVLEHAEDYNRDDPTSMAELARNVMDALEYAKGI